MIVISIVIFIYVWTLASIFYGMAVLPCFRDRARFRLFAIRDRLRSAAINGEVDCKSHAFTHLEVMLNVMARMCDWHNFSNLAYVLLTTDITKERSHERERFDAEAPALLRNMEREAMQITKNVMLVNSPVFAVVAWSVSLVSKACQQSIELKNRILWHTGESNPFCPRPMAH